MLAKLFGKSHFASLLVHMDKAACCAREFPDLFKAMQAQNSEEIQKICLPIKPIEEIGSLATLSEKLGNNIRMLLELK